MYESKQLYRFMGFNIPQTIICHFDKTMSEEIFVLSKEELPSTEYTIDELNKMEDRESIVVFYSEDDEYINSPFYCWNEAMDVVEKIELTPCNFGFPQVSLCGGEFKISVDDLEFISHRQFEETKLDALERVVYEFLAYYIDNVKKI